MSGNDQTGLDDLPQEVLEMVYNDLGTRELLFGPRQTSRRLRDSCERQLVIRKQETASITDKVGVILKKMLKLVEHEYWDRDSFEYPEVRITHYSAYMLYESDELGPDGNPKIYSALRLWLPAFFTPPNLPPVDIDIGINELMALDCEFIHLIKRGLWVPGETKPNPMICSCADARLPYHNMECAFLETVESDALNKVNVASIEEGMEQFASLQELYTASLAVSFHLHYGLSSLIHDSEQPHFKVTPVCGEDNLAQLPGCSHVPREEALRMQFLFLELLCPLFKQAWVHSRNRLHTNMVMDPDLFFAHVFHEWRYQFHGRLGAYENLLRTISHAWS